MQSMRISKIRVCCADISGNIFALAALLLVSPNLFISDTGGRDIFREIYEKPLEVVGSVCAQAASMRPFKKVALHGASAYFTDKTGRPGISASGVSASIGRQGRALAGHVSAAKAVIPQLAKVENFNIKLRADGKRLEFKRGSGKIFGGKVYAGLSVGLDDLRILDGSVRVSGLDLERFCAGTGFSPGALSGKVNFEARAEPGSLATLDSVAASGGISITNLSAEDLALQRLPIVTRVSQSLRLLRFSEVRGDFNLAEGRLNFNEITGDGDILAFKSTGWIDLKGRFNQNFEGTFSKTFVDGLPRVVRGALNRTSDGGGSFNCKITGTLDRPRIDIDRGMYNRAVGGVFREMFR